MERLKNPYKPGSLIWSIMDGGLQGEFDGLPGWDDLTIDQIAEIFDAEKSRISIYLYKIKQDTGYRVKRAERRAQ